MREHMWKRTRWLVIPAVVLFTLGLGAREAEGQAAFGAQINWGSDTDIGVGGRILGNIEDINLEAVGSFDIYFPDDEGQADLDYWEINGNLFYHIHLRNTTSVLPYLGGGLNIARIESGADDRTEVGLNLGGGIRFPTGSNITPFVEAKGVISDGPAEQFVATFGVLFGSGGTR